MTEETEQLSPGIEEIGIEGAKRPLTRGNASPSAALEWLFADTLEIAPHF